ncbi:MAG: PilZ domain-containing protein [Anaerolineales bacterium]
MSERRNIERKEFSYYMRLIDNDTQDLIGHLVDISSGGFKLDSQTPIPVSKDFRLRMELTSEVADKPTMTFIARSKWCEIDPLDPFVYNVGFQMINISPGDLNIIKRMMEKYGKKINDKRIDKRRSNLW